MYCLSQCDLPPRANTRCDALPTVVYTEPEVARVRLAEAEARARFDEE